MTNMPQSPLPGYPMVPPPAKKKKTWLWVLLGVFALVFVVCIGGCFAVGAGVNKAVKDVDANTKGKNAKPAALGTAARDGKFEFTVTSVQCGIPQVGKEPITRKAQGQFCVVDLTVKNIGDKAQTLDGASQKAYDASGTQFSVDSAAGMYLNEDKTQSTFLNQINPGNSVTGKIAFDVPATAKITKIELHDSLFSGGIAVTVG